MAISYLFVMADTGMICLYAQQSKLQAYTPDAEYMRQSRILSENLSLLLKSRTMFKNRLHALTHKQGGQRSTLLKALNATINNLTKQINNLETQLLDLIIEHYHDLFYRLQSIPGIGKSTAVHMIVVSDGFRKFDHAKQFICYVGLSPT